MLAGSWGPLPEVVHKLAHALQGGQVQVEDSVAVLGHPGLACRLLSLEKVSAGHDHMPLTCSPAQSVEMLPCQPCLLQL